MEIWGSISYRLQGSPPIGELLSNLTKQLTRLSLRGNVRNLSNAAKEYVSKRRCRCYRGKPLNYYKGAIMTIIASLYFSLLYILAFQRQTALPGRPLLSNKQWDHLGSDPCFHRVIVWMSVLVVCGIIVTIQFRPSCNQTKNPEVIPGIFCIGMAEVV